MKLKSICLHQDGWDDCRHCENEHVSPYDEPCKGCIHCNAACNFVLRKEGRKE